MYIFIFLFLFHSVFVLFAVAALFVPRFYNLATSGFFVLTVSFQYFSETLSVRGFCFRSLDVVVAAFFGVRTFALCALENK